MSKAKAKNSCRNIGRIRRRRSMIRGGKDSNFVLIGMILIEIIKMSILRLNPRNTNPCEKEEDHLSNAGDARNITCTRISQIEKTE
jgi:hypothetical protein